jgi:hypothetical protein
MENLINDLCQKTGLDKATATKVASYMKDNIGRIPQLLQATGTAGGLKSAVGNVASKVGDIVGGGRHA